MTIKCPFFEKTIVMEEVAVAVAVVVVETRVGDAAGRGTRLTWLTAHNHVVVVDVVVVDVVVVGGGVVDGIVVVGIGIDSGVGVGVGGRDSGGRDGSRCGGSDRRKSQKRPLS